MIRKIRYLGDPVLRKEAEKIGRTPSNIKALVADMHETMEHFHGIGLAAPQVGISKRVIVVNVPEEDGTRTTLDLINPVILRYIGEFDTMEEGCLSIPKVTGEVTRIEGIEVEGKTSDGKPLRFEAHGLLARCIQHEIDHLDGKLFIDHAGIPEKKAMALMKKLMAEAPAE